MESGKKVIVRAALLGLLALVAQVSMGCSGRSERSLRAAKSDQKPPVGCSGDQVQDQGNGTKQDERQAMAPVVLAPSKDTIPVTTKFIIGAPLERNPENNPYALHDPQDHSQAEIRALIKAGSLDEAGEAIEKFEKENPGEKKAVEELRKQLAKRCNELAVRLELHHNYSVEAANAKWNKNLEEWETFGTMPSINFTTLLSALQISILVQKGDIARASDIAKGKPDLEKHLITQLVEDRKFKEAKDIAGDNVQLKQHLKKEKKDMLKETCFNEAKCGSGSTNFSACGLVVGGVAGGFASGSAGGAVVGGLVGYALGTGCGVVTQRNNGCRF